MADKELPVAEVYARALLEIGVETRTLDTLAEEMKAFEELLEQETEFAILLKAPTVSHENKKGVLTKVLSGRASAHFLNFLQVLVDKDRFSLIDDVVAVFADLLDEHKGRLRGTMTTAVEATDEERRAMEQSLSKKYGKEIVLKARVDPDLIGGVVLTVGDHLIDGSVRSHLSEIRERLMRRHAH